MRRSLFAMLVIMQSLTSTALAQITDEIPVEIERLSNRVAVFRIASAQGSNVTALKLFPVLAELFPESDVAFDSLGEVYIRLEDREAAIRSFETALNLNPDNQNTARQLSELKPPFLFH